MANEENTAEDVSIDLDALRLMSQNLIEQMESLKKEGAKAQAKVQSFYREKGLELGDGLRVLTSDRVEPSDQYVFLKLLSELEKLPEAIAHGAKNVEAPAPVAAPMRALNHRYRI